jgi:hypothetical protein
VSAGHGVVVSYVQGEELAKPHRNAGAEGIRLPRLNDGHSAVTNDDVRANVWLDNGESRLVMDLQKSIRVGRVNTFSWHRSNRAAQQFTMWGSNAASLPNTIGNPSLAGWQLLGIVDTTGLGEGGIHVSSVTGAGKGLGDFHYLMWVAEDQGEGTFLSELDVFEAE